MDPEISVLVRIVDDDDDFRSAIKFLLNTEGWEVADYASAKEFLEKDDPQRPGCLLLDVRMPGMTGIELQAEMKKLNTQIPIVFLSAHGDIEMAVHTLHQGAMNFLTKPVNEEKLAAAISKAVTQDLVNRGIKIDPEQFRKNFEELTEREKQIVRLLSKGLLNWQVAERLGISVRTVELHRAHAFKKLHIHTVRELMQAMPSLN